MITTKYIIDTIRVSVSDLISSDTERVDAKDFLADIVTECVNLKEKLPRKTYNKYMADRLIHIKDLLSQGYDVDTDLDELIEELQE